MTLLLNACVLDFKAKETEAAFIMAVCFFGSAGMEVCTVLLNWLKAKEAQRG
jgi:hypothetical protein